MHISLYQKYKFGENIFQISKLKIKERIKEESYVEEVEIKRVYPGTVKIIVEERKPTYMIEKNGLYVYIDKNGYVLEESATPLEIPILQGLVTDFSNISLGERIKEEDLLKFNSLIKILDGIKNNDIEQRLTKIDISDTNNYILEFAEENKTFMLGNTSDLSTKMLWIKRFIEQNKSAKGIIHLNTDNVYFSETKEQ